MPEQTVVRRLLWRDRPLAGDAPNQAVHYTWKKSLGAVIPGTIRLFSEIQVREIHPEPVAKAIPALPPPWQHHVRIITLLSHITDE